MLSASREDKKRGWEWKFPGKGIAVLLIMAVSPTHYEWWLYLLVFYTAAQFRQWDK